MLPEAKSQVAWRDAGQRLRRHRLRAGIADQVGLSPNRQGMEAGYAAGRGHRRLRGPRRRYGRGRPPRPDARLRARRRHPPADASGRPRSSSAATASSSKIDKPDDAQASFHREWLLVRLRSDWTTGGKTYPAGGLIAIDLEAFLKGDRGFDVLFEPAERKSLVRFSPTRNHILLDELDNVRSRI